MRPRDRSAIRSRGGSSGTSPVFFAPFADAGSGIASLTTVKGGAATYTRVSVAWTRQSNGIWIQVATGQPRSYYNITGRYDGFICEVGKTNNCLQNRDFSNAAWIKNTVTALKNQIGIDGVTNSASSITATAPLGTALQALVLANQSWGASAYVQRLVGVGTLEITIDGGTTWVDVTAQVGALGTYQLVQVIQAVLNPSIGFRIGTSTDSFAIDMAQVEDTSITGITTPIVTAGATAARATDALSYSTTGVWPTNNYTVTQTFSKLFSSGSSYTLRTFTDANNYVEMGSLNSTNLNKDIAATLTSASKSTSPGTNNSSRQAFRASTVTGGDVFLNGVIGGTNDATTTNAVIAATMDMGISGNSGGGVAQGSFAIKNLRIFNTALSVDAIGRIG